MIMFDSAHLNHSAGKRNSILIFLLSILFVLFIFSGCESGKRRDGSSPAAPTASNETGVSPSPSPSSQNTLSVIPETESAWDKQEFPFVSYLDPFGRDDLTDEQQEYYLHQISLISDERYMVFDPLEIMNAIELKPGDTVADIGCGSGFITFHFANRVGNSGKVYAIDMDPMALEYIKKMKEKIKSEIGVRFDNIEVILNRESKGTEFHIPPNSLDAAFLSEVHNLVWPYPYQMDDGLRGKGKSKEYHYNTIKKANTLMMGNIMKALKPGGRLVIIEATEEHTVTDRNVLFEPDVRKMLEEYGYEYHKSPKILPVSYILIMKKPGKK